MEVKLSPELEQKVRERAGAHAASPSDVVAEALKSFFGPDSMSIDEIGDLNRSIDKGLREARDGQGIDGAEARDAALQRLKTRRNG